jgi:hypothetical protein
MLSADVVWLAVLLKLVDMTVTKNEALNPVYCLKPSDVNTIFTARVLNVFFDGTLFPLKGLSGISVRE